MVWDPHRWSGQSYDGGRWLLQYDGEPSASLSRVIGAWAERIRELDGILDTVPGFRELAITTESQDKIDWREWLEHGGEVEVEDSILHRIVVEYNGEDLDFLARAKGMSVREVIERHVSPKYTVGMVGFRPHFPYLLGLDSKLSTPRLSSPRLEVPAGSVAIGGAQTGIYPQVSPGGWHILGKCEPEVCRSIQPGHQVKFEERS